MHNLTKSVAFIATLSTLFISMLSCKQAHATEATVSDGQDTSQLILTIGEQPVYESEFRYWLNYMEKYYKAAQGYAAITNWDLQQNGLPLREYFLTAATTYICNDRAVEAEASALGIGLSSAQLEEMQTARTSNIRIYGSESEYRRIVVSMYESETVFNHLTKMQHLGNNLFAHLYGAKGEHCSDQCVAAYVEHEHFMAARYIFVSNTNKGQPLNTAQRRRNDQLLKTILAQLDASDNAAALFSQLMTAHSQDAALANYPDGRLFASGSKEQAFEQAYLQLATNQYSRIVKTDAGDYLILRMPIFPDMAADTEGNTLRYWAAYQYQFRNQVSNWCAQLPIKREAAYYHMLE